MSIFTRANWHSGLTYKQTCPECKTTVTYKDDKLDFRPWYPDGFVYCPICKKPLRHNETYALDTRTPQEVDLTKESTYCTSCGNLLKPDDNFCSKCGTKKNQ